MSESPTSVCGEPPAPRPDSPDPRFEQFQEEIRLLTAEKWLHYRMYEELSREVTEAEDRLYRVCDHVWERDYTVYEPHGSAPKICRKCQLYWKYTHLDHDHR